jgi:hypothetical protein
MNIKSLFLAAILFLSFSENATPGQTQSSLNSGPKFNLISVKLDCEGESNEIPIYNLREETVLVLITDQPKMDVFAFTSDTLERLSLDEILNTICSEWEEKHIKIVIAGLEVFNKEQVKQLTSAGFKARIGAGGYIVFKQMNRTTNKK